MSPSEIIVPRCSAKGLSQAELRRQLADAGVHVKPAAVSAWFRGRSSPDVGHVPAIVRVLELDAVQELALYQRVASRRATRRQAGGAVA